MIYRREAITSNGGRGDNRGNRRRPFRRRGNNGQDTEFQNRNDQNRYDRQERSSAPVHERPKWTPPKIPSEPLPVPDCPYCGKPIKDIASALCEKGTGKAVHFDCIIAKITEDELPEKGEAVSYIGGGRFGIVRFNDSGNPKKFTIRKILEWEKTGEWMQWRTFITDRFSVT